MPHVVFPTGKQPSSLVELTVSCENLTNMDVFSKSDPMVVLFSEPSKGQPHVEIGRTERIKDNLSPKFLKSFKTEYYFDEMVQHLVFRVYDVDDASANLQSQAFVGEVKCTMAQIVSSRGGVFRRDLENPKHPSSKNGTLIVNSVEITKAEKLKIQLHGKNLDKKDLLGKSDPYLKVYRIMDLNANPPSLSLVYESEIIKNNLNPIFKAFEIDINKLVGSGQDIYNRAFLVECYDWDANSTHDLIGQAKIVLSDLMTAKTSYTVDLINPKKQTKSGYKNSGQLFATQVDVLKEYSFLDYISNGTEVSLGVAIDFTGSNGNPTSPGTLHYIDPSNNPNDYMKAIWSVGHVIAPYDMDKAFPVYGFGARFQNGETSHDFHVNFNPASPEVHGVEGILQAYQHCIRNVELNGPTNFAPVITKMSLIAREHATGGPHPKYFVLLIITDGEISDMEETKNAIVAASDLPLSIVIVGVGFADFEGMKELDGDEKQLRSTSGKLATRDIVQFVPFRQFQDPQTGGQALAAEVLAEIPNQMVAYMKAKGIRPVGK